MSKIFKDFNTSSIYHNCYQLFHSPSSSTHSPFGSHCTLCSISGSLSPLHINSFTCLCGTIGMSILLHLQLSDNVPNQLSPPPFFFSSLLAIAIFNSSSKPSYQFEPKISNTFLFLLYQSCLLVFTSSISSISTGVHSDHTFGVFHGRAEPGASPSFLFFFANPSGGCLVKLSHMVGLQRYPGILFECS